MKIFVKTQTDKIITLEVESSSGTSIDMIRSMIQEQEGIPLDEQHLVFFGTHRGGSQRLEGGTLADYNIQEKSQISMVSYNLWFLLKKPRNGQNAPAPPAEAPPPLSAAPPAPNIGGGGMGSATGRKLSLAALTPQAAAAPAPPPPLAPPPPPAAPPAPAATAVKLKTRRKQVTPRRAPS